VFLYRTRELQPKEFPAADLVILTSASSARALATLTTGLPVVSIGPETSRAAREAGLRVVAEASLHSSEGLATAVAGLSESA
jgi:uroporphyrinogen-III synthase